MASRNGSGYALERADDSTEAYPEASKTGYSLDAWVDTEGNELSIYSLVEGKTFYASWIDDIAPTMTVTVTNDFSSVQTLSVEAIDEGSGVAGYYIGTDNPEEVPVLYGDNPDIEVSEPGMYYCSTRDVDGNVTTEQISFYAFIFDANGGSTACKKVLVQSGKEIEFIAPTKPGYSASWVEDATGEVVASSVADADKSFTANYIDDIAPVMSVDITSAVASTQSFAMSAVEAGSGVLGYYFGTSNPEQDEVAYSDIATGIVDRSGTYYFAVSDKAGNIVVEDYTFYVFALNANGGTIDCENILLASESDFTLPSTSRVGYSYEWIEDNTGESVTSSVADTNKSFTAIWTANQYTVTFSANGGTVPIGSKLVTYTSTYGDLPSPTKEGYSFLGWYTASAGGIEVLPTTVVSSANNVTLYARWGVAFSTNYPGAFDGNLNNVTLIGYSEEYSSMSNGSCDTEVSEAYHAYSDYKINIEANYNKQKSFNSITIYAPVKYTPYCSYSFSPNCNYQESGEQWRNHLYYNVNVYVYIDEVLCKTVPLSVGGTATANFDTPIIGKKVTLKFSRNMYYMYSCFGVQNSLGDYVYSISGTWQVGVREIVIDYDDVE